MGRGGEREEREREKTYVSDTEDQKLWWLFLVVNLTTSGINYNPEIGGTPVRGFCLVGWFGVNSLLVWTSEAGSHTPLAWILR